MPKVKPLSFAALTYAFTRPKNHKLFVAEAVAYLNQMSSLRGNLNLRKIIISPKPFSIKGENRCMLELVFKASDSQINRTETLRTPLAFAEGLSRRGIKEVVLKPGITEEHLELFLLQVCKPNASVEKFSSIEVYLTKFNLQSYGAFIGQVDSFLKEKEDKRCVIVLPLPVIVNGINTFTLGFYFYKGKTIVESRMGPEILRTPDALAERMANKGIRQLIFKTGFRAKDIKDVILHIYAPEE